MNMGGGRYSEVAGLFHSPDDLEQAISTLTSSGWDRAELSLLAHHHLLLPEHVDEDTAELADDPQADRQGPVSDTDMRQGRTLVAGTQGLTAAITASCEAGGHPATITRQNCVCRFADTSRQRIMTGSNRGVEEPKPR
jgi:hypothetical protein